MRAKKYYISGIVQGVGYRFFVERIARTLGLKGYVRNLPDGRVEVFAEGEDSILETLEAKLRIGPSAAEVEKVEAIEEIPKGFKDFRIVF